MSMHIYSRELFVKRKAKIAFPPGLRLTDHMQEITMRGDGHRIYEFIGVDTFGREWGRRQRYEVDAGRDEEPIVYLPLYDTINDSSLPKNVGVNRLGPGGVVFEEVFEGGEVKFSTITSSEFTVPIRHWATGLEYSKDVVIFNELWSLPVVERQVGVAHNALLNHLHLSPIITYAYTAANQTPFNSTGATATEDFMLTIEDGITASRGDTTNPRRGPYILLCNTGNLFTLEKALTRTPQQGVSLQAPSAIGAISAVIAYDGWTGTRGGKVTTYPGVPANKGYLISQQYRGQDYMSFVKQDLMQEPENERDISRFMTQTVWDSYYGVYANPLRSVEELSFQ